MVFFLVRDRDTCYVNIVKVYFECVFEFVFLLSKFFLLQIKKTKKAEMGPRFNAYICGVSEMV